jgi:hypothetical protein
MTLSDRFTSKGWMLAPACALAFILWSDLARVSRVELVSGFDTSGAVIDPHSPTGYAGGKRWLVVPEHNNPTYQWIGETQLMLARGDWRVRSVENENAPYGRDVHSASPYRWWFLLLAGCGHALSGLPIALCVERAALYSDPILHVLLLVATTLFAARRFGRFSASLMSLGIAALFPIGSAFLPGIASDFGMEQGVILWSILLLLSGASAGSSATWWYFGSGVAGGFGLWLSAMEAVPIIAGIALGGLLAALLERPPPGNPPDRARVPPPPWIAWAMGGALCSLLAYLVEYFPGHMEPELRVNYPLYGLAWLGLGVLLSHFSYWARGGRWPWATRGMGTTLLSAVAVASLPVAIWRSGQRGFLSDDLLSSRLTNLPGGVVAPSLSAWVASYGIAGGLAAAVVPVLLIAPAVAYLLCGRTGPGLRRAIAVALGPVAVALVFALFRLRWWNTFDAVLLALLAVATAAVPSAGNPGLARWLWSAALGIALVFGVVRLVPDKGANGQGVVRLTRAEVEGLYERGLADWIADRAGPEGATVLSPPLRTSSLCFYGGLRGLGTQNWENKAGLADTLHIFSSMRPDESLSVIRERGVTHIVLPSWDTDLDDFARSRLKYPEASFYFSVRNPPGGGFSWLRPLPYEVPPVAGFEDQSVLILKVTEEADPATVRSRLVEYLIEMHRMDQAVLASQALQSYPTDTGSLVALAQLAKARGDEQAFGKAFKSILVILSKGPDRHLAWDQRVSLAAVLALGGRFDLSRAEVRQCVEEIDGERIRSLTTESLYHLLLLAKRSGVGIQDPGLRGLCARLLPERLRDRL